MNMENFKSLEEVKSFTQKLNWEESQIDELEKKFNSLAMYFLYGGYIRVLDRYRIYIQCVEFYFHSERENGIKDPIVYHRNNYHVDGELPYFIPFTLHAHASGFDIAFENPEEEYRASVLIRKYTLYDEDKRKYLNYKSDFRKIFDEHNNKEIKEGKFIYADEPKINTQSLYLYDILNGFSDAGIISWVHELSEQYRTGTCSLKLPATRQNVPQYEYDQKEKEYIKKIKDYNKDNKPIYEPCTRKWSFSRK